MVFCDNDLRRWVAVGAALLLSSVLASCLNRNLSPSSKTFFSFFFLLTSSGCNCHICRNVWHGYWCRLCRYRKKNKQRNRKNSRCSEGTCRRSYCCCEYDAIYTDKSESRLLQGCQRFVLYLLCRWIVSRSNCRFIILNSFMMLSGTRFSVHLQAVYAAESAPSQLDDSSLPRAHSFICCL